MILCGGGGIYTSCRLSDGGDTMMDGDAMLNSDIDV